MNDLPAPRSAAPIYQLILAGAAAYAVFWALGRPLLPPAVQADATAGLLPAIVVTAAATSLLRTQPRAAAWVFGLTLGVLLVFVGLMRLFH